MGRHAEFVPAGSVPAGRLYADPGEITARSLTAAGETPEDPSGIYPRNGPITRLPGDVASPGPGRITIYLGWNPVGGPTR